MSNQPSDNFIYGTGTLTNDTSNTIQGAGVIGDTYALTLTTRGRSTPTFPTA